MVIMCQTDSTVILYYIVLRVQVCHSHRAHSILGRRGHLMLNGLSEVHKSPGMQEPSEQMMFADHTITIPSIIAAPAHRHVAFFCVPVWLQLMPLGMHVSEHKRALSLRLSSTRKQTAERMLRNRHSTTFNFFPSSFSQ